MIFNDQVIFSNQATFSYAVPGSGRAFQLPMPRCFAVVASCPYHIATVPHVRNEGRPRVQSLVSGWPSGPGLRSPFIRLPARERTPCSR
jgi:hypothetical protein